MQRASRFSNGTTKDQYPHCVKLISISIVGKTSGLLGYWNDNIDEEYRLPNTEFLSTTSTMAQIHHHFGQQCK